MIVLSINYSGITNYKYFEGGYTLKTHSSLKTDAIQVSISATVTCKRLDHFINEIINICSSEMFELFLMIKMVAETDFRSRLLARSGSQEENQCVRLMLELWPLQRRN